MANLPVNTCRKAPAVSALSFQNAYFKDRWPGLSWIQKQGCRPVTPLTMAAALLLKSGFLRTSAKLPDVLIILFDCSVR